MSFPYLGEIKELNDMLDSLIESCQCIGKTDKSVLLFRVWDDETVSFKHSDDLRAVIPNIEFHAIDHCGHIPHYQKAEEVNPVLLDFLRN